MSSATSAPNNTLVLTVQSLRAWVPCRCSAAAQRPIAWTCFDPPRASRKCFSDPYFSAAWPTLSSGSETRFSIARPSARKKPNPSRNSKTLAPIFPRPNPTILQFANFFYWGATMAYPFQGTNLELDRCPYCNVDRPYIALLEPGAYETKNHVGEYKRFWSEVL